MHDCHQFFKYTFTVEFHDEYHGNCRGCTQGSDTFFTKLILQNFALTCFLKIQLINMKFGIYQGCS